MIHLIELAFTSDGNQKEKKLIYLNEIKVTFNITMKKILQIQLFLNYYYLPSDFQENNLKQKASGEMLINR